MSEKKILIVDDDEFILDSFEMAFRKVGYIVRSAESAEKALEILNQEDINIMFLDLNLPGMNGVELCKQIRNDNPMALIYAVTGYNSLFEFTDCREAGFDDYFSKPVNLSVLLKTAEHAFETLDRWKKEQI